MEHQDLERKWNQAVIEASAAAQDYAALERDATADPAWVARAAVVLWRAEAVKRDLLLRIEYAEKGPLRAARNASLPA